MCPPTTTSLRCRRLLPNQMHLRRMRRRPVHPRTSTSGLAVERLRRVGIQRKSKSPPRLHKKCGDRVGHPSDLFVEKSRKSSFVVPYEVIMSNRLRVLPVVCLLFFAITMTAQDVTLDSDTISGLPIRAVGPAAMGGRIADIAA